MFLCLTYLKVRMNTVLDTEGVLVLYLKPVAHFLANFERRYERFHFRLITNTAHADTILTDTNALCIVGEEGTVNSRSQTHVQLFTSTPRVFIAYKSIGYT